MASPSKLSEYSIVLEGEKVMGLRVCHLTQLHNIIPPPLPPPPPPTSVLWSYSVKWWWLEAQLVRSIWIFGGDSGSFGVLGLPFPSRQTAPLAGL